MRRVQAPLTWDLDSTDCGEPLAGSSLLDAELMCSFTAVAETAAMLNVPEAGFFPSP